MRNSLQTGRWVEEVRLQHEQPLGSDEAGQARTAAPLPTSCGTLHTDTMPEFPHLTDAVDGEPPLTVPSRLPGSELHTLTAYHNHPRRKTQFPSLDNWQFPSPGFPGGSDS